jgi:hypothetical protein
MGIFGMIFFTRKYDVPMLALVSFFTSGMMFGMKLGKLVQLKATWNKIKKWQAGLGVQPAEGTELGMMDNAHKASCSPHADVPNPSPLPQVGLLPCGICTAASGPVRSGYVASWDLRQCLDFLILGLLCRMHSGSDSFTPSLVH